LDKDQTSNGHCDESSSKTSPSTAVFNECPQKHQLEGEDERSSAPIKVSDDHSLPPTSPVSPCVSRRVDVTKTPAAPQPYWIANPASKFAGR
uniref:Homeodomain leucine zipper protein n=1 Tax=Hydatigena taeniaeformis TaxID=6205 RepID=A0A0R3WX42_HYDTA